MARYLGIEVSAGGCFPPLSRCPRTGQISASRLESNLQSVRSLFRAIGALWSVLHFLCHDWIFAARGPEARILSVLVQLIDHVGDEELALGFVRRRRQHFAVCFGPRRRILLPTPCPYR